MLEVARRTLADARGVAPYELHCADARALPVDSAWADVAVAGWVFGHFREWMPADWRSEIGRAIGEMERTLRPGGASIVIETLGTGSEEPAPPNAGLREYFAWLEDELGFRRSAIRTDYLFPDVETAARVTGFFFGEPFAQLVRRHAWRRVPECTGDWSRRKETTSRSS
jgi:SAM-dependent methyltransferase